MGQVTHWPAQGDKCVLFRSDRMLIITPCSQQMMHTQRIRIPQLSRHQRKSMKSF